MDLLSSGNSKEMLIIFGLMLVLLQTVSCVNRNCSFNKTELCYAALGDKLSLQMVLVPYSKLIIQKENLACVIKNDQSKACNLYNNRSDITISNGTVIINSVTRADSGRYTLTFTDPLGKVIPTSGLQVNVEASIGSVNVSVECISGVRWAYCSSDGDSLFFNWTLNGQPLAQENKTTINLDGETHRKLTCTVGNHISHKENSTTVNSCPGTTTASVTTHLTSTVTNSTSAFVKTTHLIAMASSVVILIVLVITVCYIYKKKQPKSAAADGGTELVYADINHDKLNRDNKPKKTEMSSAADVEYAEVASQRKTKKKKGKEDEVQYGEVSFTPAGRNVQKQHTEQDECVYSQIYQKK